GSGAGHGRPLNVFVRWLGRSSSFLFLELRNSSVCRRQFPPLGGPFARKVARKKWCFWQRFGRRQCRLFVWSSFLRKGWVGRSFRLGSRLRRCLWDDRRRRCLQRRLAVAPGADCASK